ncbi:lysophospholipid acyltransferase family protein [Asanoa sp. WMMD1127]|uniref:lysophospholipid acyltransferase family protein n=1 Tax=Asanoa sp. WMMD1127 TaxID=3016107 RepID=UPI0024166B13|nr:lysophospholipid acyltransferase family protein [Asanoa sp. WMMD1127]MDG4825392.1 lysophospholipid acyltransferase family protein [Asanoa sp. WMMD1127]
MSSVYWLAHSGIAVAGRTPRPLRHGLASTVTLASYLGWRSKRLVTQENMAKVLGLPVGHPDTRRAALRSWSNYGRTAVSLICLPYEDMRDVDARTRDLTDGMAWHECLQKAMAPGKGTIITTGHFGSWDLAGAIAARHVPLSAIADTFKDPRINSLLQGHRRDKSVDIIPVSGAPRLVIRELRAGRAVAIVIDRPVTSQHGVEVAFFGHRTRVPAGAAALAVKTGAAVMPGYFWYAPHNGYYIRTFPPMFPRAVADDAEKEREVRRLAQYMFACQEEVVRQCPTQWFMFRRFWPVEPAAVPARAA